MSNLPTLSVLIPNRNSPFVNKTIQDVLEHSGVDTEVIVNVDENWPDPVLDDKRVVYIHPTVPRGMRAGINAGLKQASGKYIMKTDDHCAFAPDFAKTIIETIQPNWLVVPRRYSLDAEKWERNLSRPTRDYHYLCFPRKGKDNNWGIHGVEWHERDVERADPKYDIDNTMSWQGSMWFANREYFMSRVGLLDDRIETYSTFAQEPQEIGLKYWLGGGKIVINKKTWYAHLHKGKQYGRMYKQDVNTVTSHNWAARHWMENEELGMKYTMEWLVNKFSPVPTWEPNWKEIWAKQMKEGWPA